MGLLVGEDSGFIIGVVVRIGCAFFMRSGALGARMTIVVLHEAAPTPQLRMAPLCDVFEIPRQVIPSEPSAATSRLTGASYASSSRSRTNIHGGDA